MDEDKIEAYASGKRSSDVVRDNDSTRRGKYLGGVEWREGSTLQGNRVWKVRRFEVDGNRDGNILATVSEELRYAKLVPYTL